MRIYRLNPYATFVESQLIPTVTQHAVFHRLTGQLVEPNPLVLAFLEAAKTGSPLPLNADQLDPLGESGNQIRKMIRLEILIPEGHDPLASFVDYHVNRPLQNPAVTYQNETGNVLLMAVSMAERIFSPERGNLPTIIDERLSDIATNILVAADGTKTLNQIYARLGRELPSLLDDREFRDAIEFLSSPERQLIKFAPTVEGFADPFYPANLVPRNFYHASRWALRETEKSIADFHVEGIGDALWEFDIIEPTVNHALRFPSELLSGLDYGARFCDAVFERTDTNPQPGIDLRILEVGGGTGSFARSFIKRARAKFGRVSYQIMDLSPALADSQRRILSETEAPISYISQDAVNFNLPGCAFDLIVSNEVIADFPVAAAERRSIGNQPVGLSGEGAAYVEKYSLSVDDAPDRFYVNAGVFSFLERAWNHLIPGGALILSEYGSKSHYPVESFHLNHSEFTIHFGHVIECARKIGFNCRLQPLTEFLGIDCRVPVLNGREEHILCLNHVFEKHGKNLPFALFSERDFKAEFGELTARLRIDPIRFLPLSSDFHYGPNPGDFFVLILHKSSL